jgi:hypothetical protein
LTEPSRDVAHFFRANARERRREEQEHGIFFAEVIAQFHVHQSRRLLGFQSEVRSFAANRYCHNSISLFVSFTDKTARIMARNRQVSNREIQIGESRCVTISRKRFFFRSAFSIDSPLK